MQTLQDLENRNITVKVKTPVEKHLIRIIERYFKLQEEYTKEDIEAIVQEAYTRLKRWMLQYRDFIFALNGKTGHLKIDIGFFEGEKKFVHKSAFNKEFGITEDTVCVGNDPRLYDARTPLSHYHNIVDIPGLREAFDAFNAQSSTLNAAHAHRFMSVDQATTLLHATLLDRLVWIDRETTADISAYPEQIDLMMLNSIAEMITQLMAQIDFYRNEVRTAEIEFGAKISEIKDVNEILIEDFVALEDLLDQWNIDMFDYIDEVLKIGTQEIRNELKNAVNPYSTISLWREAVAKLSNADRILYQGFADIVDTNSRLLFSDYTTTPHIDTFIHKTAEDFRNIFAASKKINFFKETEDDLLFDIRYPKLGFKAKPAAIMVPTVELIDPNDPYYAQFSVPVNMVDFFNQGIKEGDDGHWVQTGTTFYNNCNTSYFESIISKNPVEAYSLRTNFYSTSNDNDSIGVVLCQFGSGSSKQQLRLEVGAGGTVGGGEKEAYAALYYNDRMIPGTQTDLGAGFPYGPGWNGWPNGVTIVVNKGINDVRIWIYVNQDKTAAGTPYPSNTEPATIKFVFDNDSDTTKFSKQASHYGFGAYSQDYAYWRNPEITALPFTQLKTIQVKERNMSWMEARATCEEEGGFLGMPKNAALSSIIYNAAKNAGFNAVWLGATDNDLQVQGAYDNGDPIGSEATKKGWRWVDGSPVWPYDNWNSATPEPNGINHAEDYMEMYIIGSAPGKWNDLNGVYNDAVDGYIMQVQEGDMTPEDFWTQNNNTITFGKHKDNHYGLPGWDESKNKFAYSKSWTMCVTKQKYMGYTHKVTLNSPEKNRNILGIVLAYDNLTNNSLSLIVNLGTRGMTYGNFNGHATDFEETAYAYIFKNYEQQDEVFIRKFALTNVFTAQQYQDNNNTWYDLPNGITFFIRKNNALYDIFYSTNPNQYSLKSNGDIDLPAVSSMQVNVSAPGYECFVDKLQSFGYGTMRSTDSRICKKVEHLSSTGKDKIIYYYSSLNKTYVLYNEYLVGTSWSKAYKAATQDTTCPGFTGRLAMPKGKEASERIVELVEDYLKEKGWTYGSNNFIQNGVVQPGTTSQWSGFWFGITDSASKIPGASVHNWYYMDGFPMGHASTYDGTSHAAEWWRWYSAQPDGTGGEPCVELVYGHKSDIGNGNIEIGWNNLPDVYPDYDKYMGYICEFNTVQAMNSNFENLYIYSHFEDPELRLPESGYTDISCDRTTETVTTVLPKKISNEPSVRIMNYLEWDNELGIRQRTKLPVTTVASDGKLLSLTAINKLEFNGTNDILNIELRYHIEHRVPIVIRNEVIGNNFVSSDNPLSGIWDTTTGGDYTFFYMRSMPWEDYFELEQRFMNDNYYYLKDGLGSLYNQQQDTALNSSLVNLNNGGTSWNKKYIIYGLYDPESSSPTIYDKDNIAVDYQAFWGAEGDTQYIEPYNGINISTHKASYNILYSNRLYECGYLFRENNKGFWDYFKNPKIYTEIKGGSDPNFSINNIPEPNRPKVSELPMGVEPDEINDLSPEEMEEVAQRWGWREISAAGGFGGFSPEVLQDVYKRIYKCCKYNGTKELTLKGNVIDEIMGSGDERNTVIYVQDLGIHQDNNWIFEYVYDIVKADFPNLVMKFLRWSYMTDTNDNFTLIYYQSFEEDERQSMIADMNETFENICQTVKSTYPEVKEYKEDSFYNNCKYYTEDEKAKISKVIHDYLLAHSYYCYANDTEYYYNQIAWPAMNPRDKYTNASGEESPSKYGPVCASWAAAFTYCCQRWGINAITVTGGTGSQRDGRHAWNMVSYTQLTASEPGFDDPSIWQEVDLTWDVSQNPEGEYSTFSDFDNYAKSNMIKNNNGCKWLHFNVPTQEINNGVTYYYKWGSNTVQSSSHDGREKFPYVIGIDPEKQGSYRTYPGDATCSSHYRKKTWNDRHVQLTSPASYNTYGPYIPCNQDGSNIGLGELYTGGY